MQSTTSDPLLQDTKWMPPEDFDTVSIFRQCNRKLKSASESTEPFKPSLKTAIEMNEVNYRPIDSFINILSSSTWPHEEQWKLERTKLSTSISKHPSKEKSNKLSKNWDEHDLSTPKDQAGHTTPTMLQITLHERSTLIWPNLPPFDIRLCWNVMMGRELRRDAKTSWAV